MTKFQPWKEKKMVPKSDHALSHDQLSVKSNFSIFEAEARWLVMFLGAPKHLYKRVCPSVRPSVGPTVGPSVRPSVGP